MNNFRAQRLAETESPPNSSEKQQRLAKSLTLAKGQLFMSRRKHRFHRLQSTDGPESGLIINKPSAPGGGTNRFRNRAILYVVMGGKHHGTALSRAPCSRFSIARQPLASMGVNTSSSNQRGSVGNQQARQLPPAVANR